MSILCALLLLSCDSGSGGSTDDPPDGNEIDYESIGALAAFPVGVAVQASQLANLQRAEIIAHAFTSLTAEYEMKMSPLWTGVGTYNFTGADAIVDFAVQHGMQVHGHALLWHNATPTWLEAFPGDDAAFEGAVHDFIAATVSRYKGRVVSWDVVNEAFDDSGNLRDNLFSQRMGSDYLARMFQYAREADPDVLLFYNDYGLPNNAAKREAVLNMVDDFQSRSIPIDGVGLQMHITVDYPDAGVVESTMGDIVSRGLKVHISELDIRVNPDGTQPGLSAEMQTRQKARYREIVSAFNALPAANRFAVTVWGLADPDSWLINFWGHPDWPLLFNGALRPKPAYDGFLEAVR
jgi:endo-1,4-beta-xylanase